MAKSFTRAFQELRSVMVFSATLLLLCLCASTANAIIIAEYDSGAGIPFNPTTQAWTATQVIEEGDPTPPLATEINTTGDGSLANVGAGATGWIVRDYLDGQPDGLDDRPEYNQALTATDFNVMESNGWRFTATFKMDSVTYDQEMRLLSLDQGGGQYLPFDIKVNAEYIGDATSNLGLTMQLEDGAGTGTTILFDTGVPAEQFNTVVMEDDDGDGDFTISVNGAPLWNHVDSNYIFDSTPNDNGVPGDDVMIFGANSTGGIGGGIEYDLLRLESLEAPTSLTIDRDTGNISIVNSGTPRQIVGYQITSAIGPFNPSNATWTSITENWDANTGATPGDGSIDSNDEWIELTNPTSNTDLSEFEPDGDGASLAAFQSIDLGNAWLKNPSEGDISAELLLFDGSTQAMAVEFVNGPGGSAFTFGDLDFDGDFDTADFSGVFVPNFNSHTSGMSSVERYRSGDFNEDDVVDELDFLIYNQAYLAANEGSSPLVFPVPEPSALSLLFCAAASGVLFRRRQRHQLAAGIVPHVLLITAVLTVSTQADAADLLAHWKMDEAASATTAVDSTGNGHTGTASGAANSGSVGIIGNAWDFGGTTSDYISVTTAPGTLTGLGDTFSITGWVKTSASILQSMFSITNNTEPSREVLLRAASSEGASGFGSADILGRPGIEPTQAVSTTHINDDQWHLLTFAQDSTGWSLYVDGVEEDSGVAADGLASPVGIAANAIHIGVNEDDGGTQWPMYGLIDDVAVWDNRLTDSEVATRYLAGLNGVDAGTSFTAKMSLEVAENTGEVVLMNDSGLDFELDLYRIRSAGNSLSSSTWTSLDTLGYDSDVWTALSSENDKVSEGAFGESTVFVDAVTPVSLGALYDESINAKDLVFEYHIAGTSPTLLYEGSVSYIAAGLGSDFDDDGDVDLADLMTWQRGFGQFSGTAAKSDGDANADGFVDASDLTVWKSEFGSTASLAEALTAVPEPGSAGLAILAVLGVFAGARVRRVSALRSVAFLLFAVSFSVCTAKIVHADVFLDREYTLGDESGEGAVEGNTLGSASSNNATWDSAGSSSVEYQDLIVNGGPTYIGVGVGDTHARPGAPSGALGASFDGTDDYLLTPINFAVPSSVWDNDDYYPALNYPHNYEGINVQGMQMWVKPNGATQNVRQDIVKNSGEHGISITGNDTWGLVADTPTPKDSGVPVAYDQWSHVMHLSGVTDLSRGSTMSGGALFIDGVVVEAWKAVYEFHENQPLTIGAMQFEGDLNGATPSTPEYFYHGLIDDVDVFLWGTNTSDTDYGTFNAGTDNEWIAMQLAGFDDGDINLDGSVSGDGTGPASTDDVTALIENWLTVQTVNGVQIGDWNSRQQGDLNFDGIVDIKDAFILREGLLASPLSGSLDFSLLGSIAVPEPTALAMAGCALGIVIASRRRQR